MDSLNQQYFYEQYSLQCYEEGDGPPLIEKRSRLLAAVVQNQVGVLQDLLDSPEWYNVSDKYGITLLEIAILTENREVFDYMLSIPDFPIDFVDSDGQTALGVALNGFVNNDIWMDQDFAYELIKKGARLDVVSSEGNNPLHCALDRSYNKVAVLLIEKGVDLNMPNSEGCMPLFAAIDMSKGFNEVVPALLIHGAVPLVDSFEQALKKGLPFFIQEMLFLYLFDEDSKIKIDLHVILKLLETKSPLFYELLKHPLEVTVHPCGAFTTLPHFYILCSMDFDSLKMAIEKFGDYIAIALKKSKRIYFRFEVDPNTFMKNLSCMLETQLRTDVISYIATMDSFKLLKDLLTNTSESDITKLYCYLLSYGLNISEWDLQLIYNNFGYCELFKVFLYMDVKMEVQKAFFVRALLPTLVYDVRLEFEKCFKDYERYSKNSLKELFSYFVHPELKKIRASVCPDENESEIPEIPLLVELARNVFRKYFIETLQIKNSREFYTLLNQLPISAVYRKIVSYETKLYKGVFCSDS